MFRTLFFGVKGGVGTSTVTALASRAAASVDHALTVDVTRWRSLPRLVGVSGFHGAEPVEVGGLSWSLAGAATIAEAAAMTSDHILTVDGGLWCPDGNGQWVGFDPSAFSARVLVTGNDYLSLARATDAYQALDFVTSVVVVERPGSPMTAKDVENVTGKPVAATVPHSPELQRAVDAGLVVSRRVPSVEPAVTALGRLCAGLAGALVRPEA